MIQKLWITSPESLLEFPAWSTEFDPEEVLDEEPEPAELLEPVDPVAFCWVFFCWRAFALLFLNQTWNQQYQFL